MIIDSFKHKGLRKALVEELQSKGITDKRVLEAIGNIPRHIFLDSSLDNIAYQDKALPIGCDQTISQPYTVAFQTQLLELKPNEKVLEIGTGSGYQTSVLCEMGARVFSIERHKPLYVRAKSVLELMKYKPKCYFGDGYKGLPAYAPFDKIIITCGAETIPEELVSQLKVGGVLVVPIGLNSQVMYKITKQKERELTTQKFGNFKFVPMLQDKES
ncbi:Protein-L-isoaspartate O-methyltransferase [bioreactor metagenome]|jgi:protein-L-isoaspartate(D-aspartate) O-methyltransferase|uniref:protein-L-isoaspartate(D-aspartate) O-methyltransferase n=1 Tax=bioreactor metagenome TaxID=1076179 RepID=A0A644TT20_9ZZZZ|nr:protein-L-isoaspartate(D-aspartate) O-methyltransferase [Bacteroidales bacterium]MEA4968346.1 protein-L-isoaspartate(D-aspartate) O-methyltransferase [Bacteroidaceae bacterium]MEA5099594.1 protein-L-isoaspartate(D-aspartate) O-methyltransferase [Bacteroidales bacterium]